MSSFAAIGGLLLFDMRQADAALSGASTTDEFSASSLGEAGPLLGDATPAAADAAFASALTALEPSATDRLRSAATPPPPEDLQAETDANGDNFILSAPTPVLSSAPISAGGGASAAPAPSPSPTLALTPQSNLASLPAVSTPVASADLLGASNTLAALAPALAVSPAIEPAPAPAVVHTPSALSNEIAALIDFATRIAFGPEPAHFGGFESLTATPVFEVFGDGHTVRAVLVEAAQPRSA